jgi:hypothetical protein
MSRVRISVTILNPYFMYSTTKIYVIDFLHLVQEHLPQTLKKLSVFEDFSDDLVIPLQIGNAQLPEFMHPDLPTIVNPRIGAAFASRSLDLEELAISYMVNAEDFFQACTPAWTWQRLQSLAITSRLLRNTAGSRRKIDTLLYKAGITALQMPRLHTLVLWNGTKGNACAFIYHAGRHGANITWRGTWDMELSPRVVTAWQRVAFEIHSYELRVGKEQVQVQGGIGSHGDAIHHLGLPCRVVEPASLWQIRREHEGTSA